MSEKKKETETEQTLDDLPFCAFATPFLKERGEDGREVYVPNGALMSAYFEHVRTGLNAKTLEAIQMGASAARVRVFVDFE